MTNRLRLDFYSEADARQIPTTPGIYAFYLRPLTPSSIGLLRPNPLSSDEAVKATSRMSGIMGRFFGVSRGDRAEGKIQDSSKASHLAMRFKVTLIEAPNLERLKRLPDRIPTTELREVLTLAGQVSLFAQPVYVGITLTQTLQQRYRQHQRDFLAEPPNAGTFGGRLQTSSFGWQDVTFGCMPTQPETLSPASMDFLEKYFQAIARPAFSKR